MAEPRAQEAALTHKMKSQWGGVWRQKSGGACACRDFGAQTLIDFVAVTDERELGKEGGRAEKHHYEF